MVGRLRFRPAQGPNCPWRRTGRSTPAALRWVDGSAQSARARFLIAGVRDGLPPLPLPSNPARRQPARHSRRSPRSLTRRATVGARQSHKRRVPSPPVSPRKRRNATALSPDPAADRGSTPYRCDKGARPRVGVAELRRRLPRSKPKRRTPAQCTKEAGGPRKGCRTHATVPPVSRPRPERKRFR